jgi:Ca2+-binding EF-hand superfamily protein
MFAQLDANKDGQLTADEIPADKKRLFERLLRMADKNNDGQLNAEEFAAGLKPRERPPAVTAEQGAPHKEGRPRMERMFKRLDTNGDGKVTLDEVPEERKEMFKRLLTRGDKDGDGALSEQEFMQAIAGEGIGNLGDGNRPAGRRDPKRLFMHLDKNHDGKVTLDEVPAERRPMIERFLHRAGKDVRAGKDGDKSLTLEEFTAAFEKGRPPERRPDAPRPGEGAASANRPGPPAGGQVPLFGGLFRALDTDHDGKLSSAEISAAPEIIRKLDKNGDGVVTPDEIMGQPPGKNGKDN